LEADESGTHIMSLNDDISYGDPVASSTGIIYLHSVTECTSISAVCFSCTAILHFYARQHICYSAYMPLRRHLVSSSFADCYVSVTVQ